MTSKEHRIKIGNTIIDELELYTKRDSEYFGYVVEGIISGMTGCELREFVGRAVVEEMARSIGMEYPEEK